MKLRSIVIGLPLLAIFSCKSSSNDNQVQEASPTNQAQMGQPEAVFDAWKQHIAEEADGKSLQPGCEPTHFSPKIGTPSKGIVVLYHGFTACPQQFYDVSEKLADLGYDVFLPLMPGQGRMPLDEKDSSGVAKDNLADLPADLNTEAIVRQAATMNKLAAAGTGIKVIGGLSGGGGLATGTAIEGKEVWNRAIFMAPFYKFRLALGPLTAFMDQIYPGFTTNYDKQCKADRGVRGKRNGVCSVTVSAMRTMLQYGLDYRKRLNELKIPVQYVGAENDRTISNKEMVEASKDIQNASICFFYNGVPHSMMSRLENTQTDHAWMDSLEKHMIAYITEGKFFPTSGVSSEENSPNCQVDKKPERKI